MPTIDEPKMPAWYTTAEERFAAASSLQAAPKVTKGATVCDTPQAIERFRMIACLNGLKLESVGIRAHPRLSMLKIARYDYNIRARTAKDAYTRLRAKMIEAGIINDQEGHK